MAAVRLAPLVPDDLIPPRQAWQERQEALAALLAGAIRDIVLDAVEFARRCLQAFDPYGTVRGLGSIAGGGSAMPLLCQILDGAGCFGIFRNSALKPSMRVLVLVIERWSKLLITLGQMADWSDLICDPPADNVYLSYLCRIRNEAAFHLVAIPIHRGICAYATTLRSGSTLWTRLTAYAGWTAHVVEGIPASAVRETLADYTHGEWDAIVDASIQKLQMIRPGLGGSNEYAPSSRRTLSSDFYSAFYARARKPPFRCRSGFIRQLLPVKHVESDDCILDNRDAEPWEKRALDQYTEEENDLFEDDNAGRGSKPRKEQKKDKYRIYSGRACILGNPTTAMPGVLPQNLLAHIFGQRDTDWPPQMEPNRKMEVALLSLLLNLGRPVDWILRLQIGRKPGSLLDCTAPLYDRSRKSFFFVPDRYVNFPDRFHPTQVDQTRLESTIRAHDLSYEHVDFMQQIILPPRLARILDEAILARNDVLDQAFLRPPDPDCTVDAGPLWLCLRNGCLGTWDKSTASALLLSLTDRLRRENDRYPAIRLAHFSRSFQGYYTELGLRSEYRHYVSGRVTFGTEVPLHYSRISAEQVYFNHARACEQFFRMILDEQDPLGMISDLDRSPVEIGDCNERDPLWGGSWYVVRQDVLTRIIAYLRGCLEHGVDWAGGLAVEQAHYNALARWTVVALSTLTGLRPGEIVDIKPHHVDLEAGRIAIQGKPHLIMPGYRRVPILPELRPFLAELLQIAKTKRMPRIFGLFDITATWRPLETGDLNACISTACQRLFLDAAPDFYSLRHRFRTDMLELGVSEHYLNYLVGHEGFGNETFNGYLDRSLAGLVPAYEQAARVIAARYGIFR